MDRREYYRERDAKRNADPEYRKWKSDHAKEYYIKNRDRILAHQNRRNRMLRTYCTRCSKNYPLPDAPYCEECL